MIDQKNQGWDLEIKADPPMLDLKLKDVWAYRDLIVLFVRRDFVSQYKQTILGPLWHIIQPIFTTIMFLLIFGKIAKIPTDGIPPAVFYMSGIALWTYFSGCLASTSSTFLSNAGIFGKVYFPRLVLPLSVVISNVVKFGIQFGLLLAVMVYYNFQGSPILFSWRWLTIPFIMVLMAGIGLGSGIIISSITTKYRDFTVLLGFAIQLGMYVTPIVYPLSYLSNKKYVWLIKANPLTPVIESFRYALLGKGTFDIYTLGYSFSVMVIMLFIGAILFNKVEKTFMDTV